MAEGEFFPTYIVVSLLTTIFFYRLFLKREESGSTQTMDETPLHEKLDWRRMALIGMICLIPLGAFQNYYRVDRSRFYYGETLLKRVFLSLEDRSILVAGMSWFNFYFYNDVMRLRDDVTLINGWDLLNDNAPSIMTPRRYPGLNLPDPEKHSFDSFVGRWKYTKDLIALNQSTRPVFFEHNLTFYDQFGLAEHLQPYRNLILKYAPRNTRVPVGDGLDPAFREFEEFVEDELKKPGIQYEKRWVEKFAFYLHSFAIYYHERGMFADEREVLRVLWDFLGFGGPDLKFKLVDNLLLDGKIWQARMVWEDGQKKYPSNYQTLLGEGLLLRSEGDLQGAIRSLKKCVRINPEAFRSLLELSRSYHIAGDTVEAERTLQKAELGVKNLRQLKKVRNLFTS